MGAKSIGSVYIDVVAKIDTLERDMAKVKSQLAGLATGADSVGKSAKNAYESFKLWNSFQGRGMLGIAADMTSFMMVARAALQELKYVYDNVDSIHGINPVAIASIHDMKIALFNAREGLDQFLAKWVISPFALASKSVGAGLGMLVTGNYKAEIDSSLPSPDELRKVQIGQKAFDAELDAARTKMNEARKAEKLSGLRPGERITALQAEAAAIMKTVNSNLTSAAADDRVTQSEGKLAEAKRTRLDLENRVVTFQRQANLEEERWTLADMSQSQRILEIKKKLAEVSLGTGMFASGGPTDIMNVHRMTNEQLQVMHDKFPEILKLWQTLRTEYKSIKSVNEELRDSFVGGFTQMGHVMTEFVTGAESDVNKVLKTITDSIIDMFFKLALVNPLLNAMFGNTKGFSILPAFFGSGASGGKATGGPASGWTMVGEQGAEMVNLPNGSNVVPAWKTRQVLGSGSGGNLYQIDARGADVGAVSRLEASLLALAGPGVVEQRAWTASKNNELRRRS